MASGPCASGQGGGTTISRHCQPSPLGKHKRKTAGLAMLLPTSIASCKLRSWVLADKESLVRNANNRSVWRNLTESFPHPYTEADADRWLSIAQRPGRDLHLAIELAGCAVGGIGAIAG